MDNSEPIWRLVDAKKGAFEALSDRIWGMPELQYAEHRSVAEHIKELEREGFRITQNLADIPTAVMGEAGQGGPVIALLGEFDALPGLSQEAGVAEPCPVEPNGNVIAVLEKACGEAASASKYKAIVERLNVTPRYLPGAAFRKLFEAESIRSADAIQRAGLAASR